MITNVNNFLRVSLYFIVLTCGISKVKVMIHITYVRTHKTHISSYSCVSVPRKEIIYFITITEGYKYIILMWKGKTVIGVYTITFVLININKKISQVSAVAYIMPRRNMTHTVSVWLKITLKPQVTRHPRHKWPNLLSKML